jgi:SAM-dependent methyltransferase
MKERTTATPARYDEFADFYESTIPPSLTAPPDAEVLRLVGPVAGLPLLDLACGYGRFTRAFARRGAEVVGIDLSRALLDKAYAFEREEPLGITYVQADATDPHALTGESFDVVVCAFGLSDIDDLDGALATVERVLRSGGRFVFSLLHPCFPGWREDASSSWQPGRGYYQEGLWFTDAPSSTLRQRVGSNHRMLSTYLNALIRHGLVLDEVAEPDFPAGWAVASPGKDPVPVFLAARCRRR